MVRQLPEDDRLFLPRQGIGRAAVRDFQQLDLGRVLEPRQTLIIPPLGSGEIEDMTHQCERVVDRAAFHSIRSPPRDEGLQTPHVDLPQSKIPDEGIQLPQEHGVIGETSLLLILF